MTSPISFETLGGCVPQAAWWQSSMRRKRSSHGLFGGGIQLIELVAPQNELFLPCVHVPQLDRLVPARRGQRFAVYAPRRRPARPVVPLEDGAFVATGRVPQLDPRILAPRGQRLAVHAPRQRHDPSDGLPEREVLLAAGRIPQ